MGADGKDRREHSRIKLVKIKPEFSVILIFNDKAIACKLRDISDGGAFVLINHQLNDKITEQDLHKLIRFKCKSADPPTNLNKEAEIVRYLEEDDNKSLGLKFTE